MSTAARVAIGALGGSGTLAAILYAVFAIEGGYVDNPNDPGGKTNHGITEKVARQHGYTGKMTELPNSKAAEIITKSYVDVPGFNLVVERSPIVAHKLIDSAVVAGTHRPSCWFQEALNSFNTQQRDYADVKVDCRVGPGTMLAFRSLESRRGKRQACELIVKALDIRLGAHMLALSSNNSRYETFGVGWIDKRNGNVDWRQCRD